MHTANGHVCPQQLNPETLDNTDFLEMFHKINQN